MMLVGLIEKLVQSHSFEYQLLRHCVDLVGRTSEGNLMIPEAYLVVRAGKKVEVEDVANLDKLGESIAVVCHRVSSDCQRTW